MWDPQDAPCDQDPDGRLPGDAFAGPAATPYSAATLTLMQPTVLVLEDDTDLRTVLRNCLTEEGFTVTTAGNARDSLHAVERSLPDAMIIDIGLPDADGRDVCQALRARGIQTPVLFLTAKDAVVDRLAGFSAGGDDYLTKPFSLDELIARLQALLRRSGHSSASNAGTLRLDPTGHTVHVGQTHVTLTRTEFRILAALCRQTRGVVPRKDLVRAAWAFGSMVHDNTLDAYIARIRRKLGAVADAPKIVTVRGVGYRIE